MVSSTRAARCGNWARGCPGGPKDFGPELTDIFTPCSPTFIMGQRVAALNQKGKQMRAEAVAARRAARSAQAGRGGQDKWLGAPGAPSAAPRRLGWDAIDYTPDGRPPTWAPRDEGNGGARRPAHARTN